MQHFFTTSNDSGLTKRADAPESDLSNKSGHESLPAVQIEHPDKEVFLPVKPDAHFQGELDPAAEAERVVKYMRAGYLARLRACKMTAQVTARIKGDSEAMDRFSGVFVAHGFLKPKDALLGSASKLSMWAKIGECEAVLATPEVSRRLPSSYSVLYQAVKLYESLVDVEGDAASGLSAFVRILDAYDEDDEVTRSYLDEKRKELKRKRQSVGRDEVPITGHPGLPTVTSPELAPVSDLSLASLILLTPSDSNWRKLRESYAEPSPMKRMLPLANHAAEDATLVVLCRVRDIPVVQRLALQWEFPVISHAIKVCTSDDVDLIDAEVMIAAERSPGSVSIPQDRSYLHEGEGLKPAAIAGLLVPDARTKLHVFASEETEGWVSWIGDTSWAQEGASQ